MKKNLKVKWVSGGRMVFLLAAMAFISLVLQGTDTQAGGWNNEAVLTAETGTAISDSYELSQSKRQTFFITATGGSVSATVLIQASADNTNWSTLKTVTLSAAGTTSVAIVGPMYRSVRANISAYSAGTITVTMGWD